MTRHRPTTILAADTFREALIDEGLLTPGGVDGVYLRGARFEAIQTGLERLITSIGRTPDDEILRLPPVLSRTTIARSRYLDSFPQLLGAVHSCLGEDDHASETAVVLTPAACYHVYPLAAGRLPEGGRRFDIECFCFRHEPSPDPARMQAFRLREFVHVGEAESVLAWRDEWRDRATQLAEQLGLKVATDRASDPFFGAGARLLAATQREQGLKYELLTPISSDALGAVMSFNYHQDHFGELFGIETSGGEVAHTACVGFGMERLTLALLRRHGLDTAGWPDEVQWLFAE